MKSYRPGELIDALIEFQHTQVVSQVLVVYRHTEDASAEPVVLLSDEPWTEEELASGIWASGAQPTAEVASDQKPGTYRLDEIVFETYSGNRIPLPVDLESPALLPDTREFRIMEEPDDPPTVTNLRIT
jgi:hypothetical protein